MDPDSKVFGTMSQLQAFLGLSNELTAHTWEQLKSGALDDDQVYFLVKGRNIAK
jgi:hypothetical protein